MQALQRLKSIVGLSTVSLVRGPVSKEEVCVGQSVTLSIATEGTPQRCVWQYSQNGEEDWRDVVGSRCKGAKTSTLTVMNVQKSDEGFYRCMVHRHTQDREPLVSTLTTLTVVSLPTVSGLEDRRVVAVGANTVLSVEAEGVSLSFQWQHVSAHEMKQEQQEAEGLGAEPDDIPNCDRILESVYPRLTKHFTVKYAFSHLREQGLITADQQEKLMLPANTNLDMVDLLIVWLPKVGEGYLDKFIICLRKSSEDCPVHNEIADVIETALGRSVNAENNREGYAQLNGSESESWTDIREDEKFSGCRESCLRVSSVCGSDAGFYRCCVSNDAGTVVSSPIELVLAGAPKILEDLKDIKVAPHCQVSLKVDAVGEGSLTYVWQRRVENSTEWKAVPSETKYQGQGTASLVVANVEERDVGLFRCLVFSDGGQCVTKEALLRIENSIQVQLQPTDTTVVMSKDLTLSVEAHCADPLTYTWQKRCTESKKEEWELVSTSPSNTTDSLLTISDVTASDAGMYRCLIRSKTGSSVFSQPASVTVVSIDKVVAKFLGDCESAVDVEDLAALFVKEHGTSSQVTRAVLLDLVQSETDRHRILNGMLDFSVSTDVQKDGLTLLHLACMKRLTQSVKVLLASGVGCNPNTDDSVSQVSPPLHLAAERGYCDVMELLMNTANKSKIINAKDKKGQTALHAVILATQSCSLEDQQMMELTEAVKILVDNGARVDVQDVNLRTPLHLAAASGQPHIIYFLLNTDRSIATFRDEGKNTALHVACAEGSFNCATAILDFPEGSLTINAQNENGNTALRLAYAGGFDEIVELLLQKGADKTLCHQAGEKAMSSTNVQEFEQNFENSPALQRGLQRQHSVDYPFIDKLASDWRWSSVSISYNEPPMNTAIHSVGGQLLADTLEEIKAMNRAMAGFKGTLPQYQNRVEAGAPHRSLLKQGPLIKFSRTEKSLRFFYLFSDVLIVTEEQGHGRCLFKQAMPIHFMLVGRKSSHSDSPLSFDVYSVTRSLTLQASCEEEKLEWLQVLETCIGEYNQMIGRNPLISDRNLLHAPIYEPDENVSKCQLCEKDFTITNRRHHCRACGKAICKSCSLGRGLLPHKRKATRVCDRCLSGDSETVQVEEPGVLERAASTDVEVLKRGYVRTNNARMWYELDRDGVFYIYKASKDGSAERTLPLLGYNFIPNRGDLTLRLTHQTGDELFAVEDIREFDEWKSAIDKVLP